MHECACLPRECACAPDIVDATGHVDSEGDGGAVSGVQIVHGGEATGGWHARLHANLQRHMTYHVTEKVKCKIKKIVSVMGD